MNERSKADQRAARLAEQLRANLRRRKAQARAAGNDSSDQPDLSKKDGER
ncbi:hypothetical protein [Alteriqipengyuania sp. 357]